MSIPFFKKKPLFSLALTSFFLCLTSPLKAEGNGAQSAVADSLSLNDANFKATIEKGIWVVDFSAEWCGPCKRFEPIFKQVARELPSYHFAQVNTDQNPASAQEMKIKLIPTIIFFSEGKEIKRKEGGCDRETLKQWIVTHPSH